LYTKHAIFYKHKSDEQSSSWHANTLKYVTSDKFDNLLKMKRAEKVK